MRDIRPDIRERVAAKRRERQEFVQKTEQVDADIAALDRLLSHETSRIVGDTVARRFGADAAVVTYGRPKKPLEDYLLMELASGPKLKDELREAAEGAGYFAEGKNSPGRVIHATVLHLIRAKKVMMQPDKRVAIYRAHQNALGSLLLAAQPN